MNFEQKEVKFLGYIIGADGVNVDPAKVAVIRKWLCPTNVHGVRYFVGLATLFRKFIEAFPKMLAPLTHLTKKDVPLNGMMHAKQLSLQLSILSQTLQYWLCQTSNCLLLSFVTHQKEALELSFTRTKDIGL